MMSNGLRSLTAFMIAVAILGAAVAWRHAPEKLEPARPLVGSKTVYWKGNLHTHSLWSDGDDYPEMIADWYKSHGYQFLALSDHNVLSEGQRWMAAGDKSRAGGTALRKDRKSVV